MEHCDVLIVGGGPAGSTLAWALRGSGLDVAVMDKRTFPRDKVCAGWITPAVVSALELDTQAYARERVFQPIHGFRVSYIGGPEVDTYYNGAPVSFGIRRREFDHYLLQRCEARVLSGEPFKGMESSEGAWLVNGRIRTPLVIGAGGHFCPVARALGAKLGRSESVVAAQEVEFEMTPAQSAACSVREDMPELFFCEDLKGYGWIFRKNGYLNIGLGREDNHRLSEHVAAACDFMKARGKIPVDTPDAFKGHAYLLYNHAPRPLLSEGVLLVGDAAGLAYPQSGEGIRPAVESALLAARVIRGAAGDYGKGRLEPYQQSMMRRFGERQASPGLSDRLPAAFRNFMARRLLATHWFTRNVVMDRWFLHVHEEPLEPLTEGAS